MADIRSEVLSILTDVCKEEAIRENPDIELFSSGLLDSMGLVEVLVEIESRLNLYVSITDFERDEWSTPNRIIAYLEQKLAG
jgi:D-alanine--poly(phosphoribitol) ligase subunit 2